MSNALRFFNQATFVIFETLSDKLTSSNIPNKVSIIREVSKKTKKIVNPD